MNENYEKIVEVLAKESLQDELDACLTETDVVKLLSKNGVNITENELRSILKQLVNRAHELGIDIELDEKQLEQVAGGFSWGSLWKGFKNLLIDIKDGISTLGQHGGA